jgi:phosphoribosyl 1,2-cyclic phosphate phosphodiesterase
MEKLMITVLGSGTSQGVPVIACDCSVCQSPDSRDKRLRSALLFQKNKETFCIDTGPDFRQQMLNEQVKSLRGVLFTHEHKDHVAGLDDVRAFNFFEKRPMQIYCSKAVELALKREFQYVFEGPKHAGIPSLEIHTINQLPFELPGNIWVQPIQAMHDKLPVLGFRVGRFCYLTDVKTIAKAERDKLKDLDVLIVNALRKEAHRSHFNLTDALLLIDEVKPKKAFLTHISHMFGTHEEIEKILPPHVKVCYDGMKFEV